MLGTQFTRDHEAWAREQLRRPHVATGAGYGGAACTPGSFIGFVPCQYPYRNPIADWAARPPAETPKLLHGLKPLEHTGAHNVFAYKHYEYIIRSLHRKHYIIRKLCTYSLFISALYAKCPYYVGFYMQTPYYLELYMQTPYYVGLYMQTRTVCPRNTARAGAAARPRHERARERERKRSPVCLPGGHGTEQGHGKYMYRRLKRVSGHVSP